MRHRKLSAPEQAFVQRVQEIEETLFADQLDPKDSARMKSDKYSWLYRPSHHAATGLITESDITSGKRILSVGAHPGFLERVLIALGLPADNLVIADSDPGILSIAGDFQKKQFDMTDAWPELGMCDLILFPESLCISLSNKIEQEGTQPVAKKSSLYPTDTREAELLAFVLTQALKRLRPAGEIRANGPMSHPNVVKTAQEKLRNVKLEYQRFFLRIAR